jgi:hypothetical protein
MQRVAHGFSVPPTLEGVGEIAVDNIGLSDGDPAPPAGLAASNLSGFGYLFEWQNDPASLLPELPGTLEFLTHLGVTMLDANNDTNFDSNIPAAYTYLGQFIDHDIIFTEVLKQHQHFAHSCILGAPELAPLADAHTKVQNLRKSILQLDCVYGSDPPRKDDFLLLSNASKTNSGPPTGLDAKNRDLPRGPKSAEARADRVAHIGDKRNDQNLIISQLHVAFLRAHNALVSQGKSFDEARTLLQQFYHRVVVYDFLRKQIADPNIVDEVLSGADLVYNPTAETFFLPLEFTAAAFRFGHSMIRSTYYLNNHFQIRTLGGLFTLTALSGNIVATPGLGFPTLPDNKIIHWKQFLRGGINVARRIDTQLVEPLFTVLDETEQPVQCERRLAVQDLKRGYMMKLPTGQAMARALKPHVHAVDIEVLTPQQIKAVAANADQRRVLEESGFLLERTPLWFYILAEAAHGGGNRLGPVGSRVVAEVIIGLIRMNNKTFPNIPGWPSALPISSPVDTTLTDLLNLAGVVEATP